MKGVRSFAALLVFVVACLSGLVACSRKSPDGTEPQAVEKLPDLVVRDDTPNLMLTWLDEKGGTHTEVHPGDIPVKNRGFVRVVSSEREEGTRDRFYVVDFERKREDGSYLAKTISRREWEAEIERRREPRVANKEAPPAAPPPGSGGPASPDDPKRGPDTSGLTVVIYGASWCKPCHQAADFLKARGIAYVMKDVEQTAGVMQEMQEKLEKSGQRGGSIPVIDVGGQILVGFSEGAINRALRKATRGTVL